MRKSVITTSAKNVRSLSGRRRLATIAATAVLAGGIQFLTTDAAWAADAGQAANPGSAPTASTAVHNGHVQAGLFMTKSLSITAGGPKVEIPVEVVNFTGAPYRHVTAGVAFRDTVDMIGLDSTMMTVEALTPQGWRKVSLGHSSDGFLGGESPYGEPLQDGRAAHFTFRVGLSATAPHGLTRIQVNVSGSAEDNHGDYQENEMSVVHPAAPAKPAPGKPTPSKTAKPAAGATQTQAQPVADRTPAPVAAAAVPAPAAAAVVPAVAEPATPLADAGPTTGAPELARTGVDAGWLTAAVGAVLLALGAGARFAARRLRPRR
ncbi:hypothetical protein ACFVHB_13610 [Kitasatospora sp. NPDC127111]|uniref:hypothetical protein n=1 Tax=Kitasatospora sp. NPDC127111 TaxID=3345363 RepID=UPI00362FE687